MKNNGNRWAAAFFISIPLMLVAGVLDWPVFLVALFGVIGIVACIKM